ncbi:hypothetical protein SERLA73DRAFT_180516, partial [Serpula lacrymans var. lacrymans S7.3]
MLPHEEALCNDLSLLEVECIKSSFRWREEVLLQSSRSRGTDEQAVGMIMQNIRGDPLGREATQRWIDVAYSKNFDGVEKPPANISVDNNTILRAVIDFFWA